jgi:transposase InsO family protein
MPWREVSAVSQRYEFVMLASQEGANVSALCRSFGISRTQGYKWLARFAQQGASGLEDRSRRPRTSPARTAAAVERRVEAVLARHPTWGGRKVRNHLLAAGCDAVPAASTITGIKHRQGLIAAEKSARSKAFIRFEHAAPNDLLQLDFKGHFAIGEGRCHPLTLIDDHSRYSLAIEACADERGSTVQERLTQAFRRYGLPWRMTMDNGPPWGSDAERTITPLTLWLIRLDIRVSHSRPYHPQTQGKNERFNRTLNEDVIAGRIFHRLADCQSAFDLWREVYNFERPHDALGGKPPASRYAPSPRAFPERLPEISYPAGACVRKVQHGGRISYRGRELRVPGALHGHPVAVQPRAEEDGVLDVFFCATPIAAIDLKEPLS